MKATEKRLLEETARKQKEHDRQMQAIEQANMDAQSQHEVDLTDLAESQRRNNELYKKLQELRSSQADLQMKMALLQQNRPSIVEEKRKCTVQ